MQKKEVVNDSLISRTTRLLPLLFERKVELDGVGRVRSVDASFGPGELLIGDRQSRAVSLPSGLGIEPLLQP